MLKNFTSTELGKYVIEILSQNDKDKLIAVFKKESDKVMNYFQDISTYQTDLFIEVAFEQTPQTIVWVAKSSKFNKNSWNDDKVIEWLNNNPDDILRVCKTLSYKNNYETCDLSPRVIDTIFELVIKDHILNKESLIAKDIFKINNLFFGDTQDHIAILAKAFPIQYLHKFEKMAPDLFEVLLTKPISFGKYQTEINFIQHIYIEKSRANKKTEAQEIFIDYKNEVILPVTEKIHNYIKKTDVFEYFLRTASSERRSSWDFFAPLDSIVDRLNETQQRMFVVVALTELYINDIDDRTSDVKNRKSDVYKEEDVIASLLYAPLEMCEEYIKDNHMLSTPTRDKLNKTILFSKLDNDLSQSTPRKSMKI